MDDPETDRKVVGFLVALDPDYPHWPLGVGSALSMICGVASVTYVYEGDAAAVMVQGVAASTLGTGGGEP